MNFEVLLVTDPGWPLERLVEVTQACSKRLGERFGVQVRDPLSSTRRAEAARALRPATRAFGSSLWINRDVPLARAIDADGVHGLPWEKSFSMPAHDDAELGRAIELGASAVLLSPIFQTPGKGPPRGLDVVRKARASAPASSRIVALGGINATNAIACRCAGADAVAAIRSLLEASDPAAVAAELARSGESP